MDDAELLATFDRQVRRSVEPEPGFTVELVRQPAPLLRLTPVGDAAAAWGGGVFWCDLEESTANAAIEATIAHFGPLGREFEWKYYAYDRPADLTDRLRAHGFEPDEEEAVVVGEISEVRERLAPAAEPDGIIVRRLRTDPTGAAEDWQGIDDLHRAVWGTDGARRNAAVRASIAADPDRTSMWVAVAGDGTVVCAGRVNFHRGTDFASLWGGGTLAEYRGRGVYRALVSRRADEAADRGCRFLQVDASPESRPILERLGLRVLTTTTPWMWRPERG